MFHTPVECCTEKKIRNKQIFNDASKRKGWDEVVVLCIIFVKKGCTTSMVSLHIIMAKDSLLILSAHSLYLLGDHEVQTEENFNYFILIILNTIVTFNSSIHTCTLYPRPNTRNLNQRPMDFIFYFNSGGDIQLNSLFTFSKFDKN